jgi:SAM-dependent methyltransferase
MNQKKINEHYNDEVKEFGSSIKSTMPDIFVKKLEIEKISNSIKQIKKDHNVENILEIGCGNGYVLKKISKNIKSDFLGVDVNKKMIELAKKRKRKELDFKVDDITNSKLKSEKYDIIFTERCLINLMSWELQKKAINQIYKLLKKDGTFIMLEAFTDGLNNLNLARKALGLKNIEPAWHNNYFVKKRFEKSIKMKFCFLKTSTTKNNYDNFLSSYYFGSRILYPSLIESKGLSVAYNNKFIEFYSYIEPVGNYSPLQLCMLKKRN